MKLEMSFQLDCFIISQVKPLLPAFYTYCVNRICIIKAKINKNKMQIKTGGELDYFLHWVMRVCVLLFKLYSQCHLPCALVTPS